MTSGPDLLGIPPTHLPEDPAAARLAEQDPRTVAAAYPASSLVWAVLAETALLTAIFVPLTTRMYRGRG